MNIIQNLLESKRRGNYFKYGHVTIVMRGRWAAFAVGRAVANNRAQQAVSQQQQEADRALQQKNQEIERLREAQSQQAKSTQSPQEDVTQKIQKLGDLHQKGLLTDEEFSKLKMDLLSKL
jgi:TolA-binding protein